jgi:pimeloyl-ACP methyl ester carboxylesterase
MAEDFVASVAGGFDLGTERALLKLLRSASPELLAAAGAGLSAITAPALVLWGAQDPYIPARFGAGYAATLGDATLETIDDAGHWPWLDRPQLGERIIGHLAGDPPP